MASGIRATVEFANPDLCPIVGLSAAGETTIDSIDANVCPDGETTSVTEFWTDADCEPDGDVTEVFSHGSTRRYRLVHDGGVSCPCECLGRFDCPVDRYVAEEGTLTLVFHAAGYEELQVVVAALRERFPEVNVKRFVRSPAGESAPDGVFVDRSKLTGRQREVLQTAHEMGYFERPRRANATEIAAELEIDPSTFSEHLAAAQVKILDDVI